MLGLILSMADKLHSCYETPNFPMGRLPYLAQRHVFMVMAAFELINTSRCSKNLKQFTTSLFRFSKKRIHITFSDDQFSVSITKGQPAQFNDDPNGHLVLFSSGSQAEVTPAGSPNDWIACLMQILNCDGVYLHFLTGCERFTLPEVQKLTKGFRVHGVSTGILEESYIKMVLRRFQTVRNLSLTGSIQGFKIFLIKKMFDSIQLKFHVTFEHILFMDSKNLEIRSDNISINEILKLWIVGWNPRLEFMFIETTGANNPLELLDMLNYQEVKEKRTYNRLLTFQGGYELRQIDGTKAFVHFKEVDDNIVSCYLIVEH